MALRRRISNATIERRTYRDFGRTRFRYLSGEDERLPENANAQGVVLKVEHRTVDSSSVLGSVVLPGDSDAQTWRKGIMLDYGRRDLSSSLLMAFHHGSISFFDDPGDPYYYQEHLEAISPDMTIISVGPNLHGHPDETAIGFYEQHSSGSNKGNKVYRTDQKGSVGITLKDEGGWQLSTSR
jgi:beta-lactamase superfamily II metal-dependent hydrolase